MKKLPATQSTHGDDKTDKTDYLIPYIGLNPHITQSPPSPFFWLNIFRYQVRDECIAFLQRRFEFCNFRVFLLVL